MTEVDAGVSARDPVTIRKGKRTNRAVSRTCDLKVADYSCRETTPMRLLVAPVGGTFRQSHWRELVRACREHPHLPRGAEPLDRVEGLLSWPSGHCDASDVRLSRFLNFANENQHQLRLCDIAPSWNGVANKLIRPDTIEYAAAHANPRFNFGRLVGPWMRVAADIGASTATDAVADAHETKKDAGRGGGGGGNGTGGDRDATDDDDRLLSIGPMALHDPGHGSPVAVSHRGWTAIAEIFHALGHYVEGVSDVKRATECGALGVGELSPPAYAGAKRFRAPGVVMGKSQGKGDRKYLACPSSECWCYDCAVDNTFGHDAEHARGHALQREAATLLARQNKERYEDVRTGKRVARAQKRRISKSA